MHRYIIDLLKHPNSAFKRCDNQLYIHISSFDGRNIYESSPISLLELKEILDTCGDENIRTKIMSEFLGAHD